MTDKKRHKQQYDDDHEATKFKKFIQRKQFEEDDLDLDDYEEICEKFDIQRFIK